MDSQDLKFLRCPQNWNLVMDINFRKNMLREDSNKMDEYNEVSNSYSTMAFRFRYYYVLSYEFYRTNELEEALAYLDKADVTDNFIKKYKKAFNHAIEASRAYIYYKKHRYEEASKIVSKLKIETYSVFDEAAFNYIKSGVIIKCGSKCDYRDAVKLITSAIKLVDNEAEFHFSLGSSLGKIRRYNFPPPHPSNEEITACKKAIELKGPLVPYALTLTRVYCDIRYNVSPAEKAEYGHLAKTVIRNVLKENADLCGNSIAKCIFQLMRIDVTLVSELEEYAEIALKRSNSIVVNHYIGDFYFKITQFDKALQCWSKVVTTLPFLCSLVLLLMYRKNNNNLHDDELTTIISNWEPQIDPNKLSEFELNLSEFYLLVKGDVCNALIYFLKAYHHKITKKYLVNLCKCHKNSYLIILKNELLNHSSVIAEEAKSAFQNIPISILGFSKKEVTVKDLRNDLLI